MAGTQRKTLKTGSRGNAVLRQGFILILEGFSWLQITCNKQMWNQRKPNETKIKPVTVLRQGFILVLEGFSWLQITCNKQMRNQRKPNKTKIKPITVSCWQDCHSKGFIGFGQEKNTND